MNASVLPTLIDFLVTGANRGIGLELTTQLLAHGKVVVATYRQTPGELSTLAQQYPNQLFIEQLDVTDKNSLNALGSQLTNHSIHCLINNAGIYGPSPMRFGELQMDDWQHVLHTNTIAPLLVTQTLFPMLKQHSVNNAISKVAFVSSKMGSIADNTSGGSYLYRSSKAALNAAVKSFSHDAVNSQVACVTLHPGWVQTEMGGPNALIDTETSARGLLSVIDNLTLANTGKFINYDGSELPW